MIILIFTSKWIYRKLTETETKTNAETETKTENLIKSRQNGALYGKGRHHNRYYDMSLLKTVVL